MRRLLHRLLYRPVLWLTNRYASRPNRLRIFDALSTLLQRIAEGEEDKGLIVPFDLQQGKFIIFSDQHKGTRNGADDFRLCEPAYLAALDHYHRAGYGLICLGDSEELWENTWPAVRKAQTFSFEKEKAFIDGAGFIKIFGNHDLMWDNDPLAGLMLKDVYGVDVPIHEGVLLQTTIGDKALRIFCTHGHQGDEVSDGNWFSKFFVSRIWAPLQAYLRINPNTPAYDNGLKTLHNSLMYQWSAAQKNLLLITGHTHQPVFESLTHLERLYRRLLFARKENNNEQSHDLEQQIAFRKQEYKSVSEDYLALQPSYFNTGCCCFPDGDITGIEISDAALKLVQWKIINGQAQKLILEETPLADLLQAVEEPERSVWI